jgi:uncharacterized membrane protein
MVPQIVNSYGDYLSDNSLECGVHALPTRRRTTLAAVGRAGMLWPMPALTVWKFERDLAAEEALPRLERLAVEGAISIGDAAVVSWPESRRKPSMRTLGSLTGPGELWGGVWGILLGLIFLVPLAGPVFGAGAGAIAGSLSDFGVDDDFIRRARTNVTPGSSALFVFSSDAVADDVAAALADLDVDLVRCNLSLEHERRLRETLGEESGHPVA